MSQITTHILDTARGTPAEGVPISLYLLDNNKWKELATGITNDDGRISDLLEDDYNLQSGTYKMKFETKVYFENSEVFYPYVEIVFNLNNSDEHYHIPLLLSPYGYTTYRGS